MLAFIEWRVYVMQCWFSFKGICALYDIISVMEFSRWWVLKSVSKIEKKKTEKFVWFLTQKIKLECHIVDTFSQNTMISFEYVDFWPTILLFRTHHLWNSTTKRTFMCITWYWKDIQSFTYTFGTVYPVHRGAFCQFSFRWIYYCNSNKSWTSL